MGEGSRIRVMASSRRAPWAVFVAAALAHLWFTAPTPEEPWPYSDLGIYRAWMSEALETGTYPGADGPWVYPVLALGPLRWAALWGLGNFQLAWQLTAVALHAGVLATLTRRGGSRPLLAAWAWTLFFAVTGPLALSRIDGFTTPLAAWGLLVPSLGAVSGTLLAAAVWIKVWPAGVVLSALATLPRRRSWWWAGITVSAVALGYAWMLGAQRNLLGFLLPQQGRGLQIEAPAAQPFLWMAVGERMAAAEGARHHVVEDQAINTMEITGPGVGFVSSSLDFALAGALLVVLALAWLAVRRGGEPTSVFLTAGASATLTLIALNKVGSPQFVLWTAPLVVALVVRPVHGFPPLPLTVWLVVLGAVTSWEYPFLYDELVGLEPLAVGVTTLRNLLVAGGWFWCCRRLAMLARK